MDQWVAEPQHEYIVKIDSERIELLRVFAHCRVGMETRK
jgi:hypothetical protein